MNSVPLTLADTKNVALHMAKTALSQGQSSTRTGALVVGLFGDLGAGKTTFMQFFGEGLGVKEKMLSPTFVIEKIYKLDHRQFDHLIHIDAYRIEDPKEILNLGWDEIVKNPRNIICIEWADKIGPLLPRDHVGLYFEHHDNSTRRITDKSHAQ